MPWFTHRPFLKNALTHGMWVSVLLLILLTSMHYRLVPLEKLQDDSLIGPDSYRHTRYMEQYVEDGEMSSLDRMRDAPLGHRNTLQSKALPWVLSRLFFAVRYLDLDATPHDVAIRYPAIMTPLTLLVFFALAWELFDSGVALFSCSLLATIPGFLGRTIAGYVDSDAFIILLLIVSVYLYVLSLKRRSYREIYRIGWNLTLATLAILWPGVGLAGTILYGTDILLTLHRRLHRRDRIASLIGICLYVSMLFLPGSIYRDLSWDPYIMTALVLPSVAGVIHLLTLCHVKHRGMLLLLAAIFVAGTGIASWMAGSELFMTILHPFGRDPIMTSVEELQPTPLVEWWKYYGPLSMMVFLGPFLLTWGLPKDDPSDSQYRVPEWKLSSATVIWAGMAFSVAIMMSLQGALPSVLRLVVIVPILLWGSQVSRRCIHHGFDDRVIVVFWFLTTFALSCSAVRFHLFLSPMIALVAGLAFARVFQFFFSGKTRTGQIGAMICLALVSWQIWFSGSDVWTSLQKSLAMSSDAFVSSWSTEARLVVTVLPSVLVLAVFLSTLLQQNPGRKRLFMRFVDFLILFLLAVVIYGFGLGQRALAVGTSYPLTPEPTICQSLVWLKSNTPEDAVIAAEWSLGSSINYLARRATIIDDEQDLAWIRDFYRHVLFGTSEQEAREFLQAHHATHFLFDAQRLGVLNRLWTNAFPEQTPKTLVFPMTLGNRMGSVLKLIPTTPSILSGGIWLQSIGENKKYTIEEIICDLEQLDGGMLTVRRPPRMTLRVDGISVDTKLTRLVLFDQPWDFPESEAPLTLWISGSSENYSDHTLLSIRSCFLLMEPARDFFMMKLLLGERPQSFDLIYKQASVRIWEIPTGQPIPSASDQE